MHGMALEQLLNRIRDGIADDAELERAKELLASDARFPDELRDALDDEPVLSAPALLSCLGVEDGFGAMLAGAIDAEAHVSVADSVIDALFPDEQQPPVAEAVVASAGDIEITAKVLEDLALEMVDVPIVQAVEAHAGQIEIVAQVLAKVGMADAGLPIAQAVESAAGRVDLVQPVLTALGLDDVLAPVADAVRAQAGVVDVVAPVMAAATAEASTAWVSAMLDGELDLAGRAAAAEQMRGNREATAMMTAFASIGRELREAVAEQAGEVDSIWAAVAPEIGIADPEEVPGWDGALLAEAVRAEAGETDVIHGVMSRVMGPAIVAPPAQIPEPANRGWQIPAAALAAAAVLAVLVNVPSLQGTDVPDNVPEVTTFASATEITVNELSYAENVTVQVFQAEGEEGPLVIWLDEETSL